MMTIGRANETHLHVFYSGHADGPPSVTPLQRHLLHILHADRRIRGAWGSRAGMLGFIEHWIPPTSATGMREVKGLRERILAIDPNACIYETWGGPLPDGYVPAKTWAQQVREARS